VSRTAIRVFLSRALDLLFRRRREMRLRDELQAHLDALTDEYVARGMSLADARIAARRAFGGVDQVAALYREQRGLPSIDWLFADVRYACRVLAKDRTFAAGVILVLGLGLAVNTTIFTIISGMSWRGLPVDEGDRVMQVATREMKGRRSQMLTSYADFADWRTATKSFRDLAAYATATANLGDARGPAERVAGVFITANGFSLLRVVPAVGRDFSPADDQPGAAPVVILGHHVWTSRYAADPSVLGMSVRINGQPTTVIGVMPPGFRFPVQADLWQPALQYPGVSVVKRDERHFNVVGRLTDGVTLDQARAEFTSIAAAMAAQHRDTNADLGATIVPFTEAFVSPPSESGPPALMFVGAIIVLLIACANAANLLLARAAHRSREMALRAALGASRFRIVRQLLIETLMLSAGAALLGLGLSVIAVRYFASETIDLNLPYWIAFEFDARVFSYVAGIAIATAMLFGLAPAWQLSRTTAADILRQGGRGAHGTVRSRRWASGLLVGELSLTLTLLAGASLLVKSSIALHDMDAVLDLRNILAAQITLPASSYQTPEQRLAFYDRLQERLKTDATLMSASIASARPFVDATSWYLVLEGEDVAAEDAPAVQAVAIGDRYFETLGLELIRGRTLRPGDDRPGNEAVVINQQFAQFHFRGTDAIGRRIHLRDTARNAPAGTWFTVVGIAPSVRQRPMGPAAAIAYFSLALHSSPNVALVARARDDVGAATATMRDLLRSVDPDIAAFSVEPLQRLSEKSRWTHRIMSVVLVMFALIAAALSGVGLYGVTAYTVAQRTPEIGVRMALGATRSDVASMFLRRTFALVGLGLAIGLTGALAFAQLLRGILVQTSPADPVTFTGITAFMIVIAAVACLVPTRRAARLDPVTALRHE
jgi:putative ABC transport system permease protein